MIGDSLGPYRVERELGAGGMGRVFAAVVEGRCPGLDVGTRVALKVVHPHLLDEVLARVPEDYHEPMSRNVRVNREILAACAEQGI